MAGRGKTAYRPGFDDIAALDRALREDTPKIGWWLDTSDLTPEQSVDAIVAEGLKRAAVSQT